MNRDTAITNAENHIFNAIDAIQSLLQTKEGKAQLSAGDVIVLQMIANELSKNEILLNRLNQKG